MRLGRKGAPETGKPPVWERENQGFATRGPLQRGGLEDVEALWGPPGKGPALSRVYHCPRDDLREGGTGGCGLQGGGQESEGGLLVS